jgi:membrane-associated protease RseP (regulator of RpoE activity)
MFLCLIALLFMTPSVVLASDATRLVERQRLLKDVKQSLKSLQSGSDTLRDRATRTQRPVIGILLGEEQNAHVRIIGVTPQGAAAEAGVRSGDLLVSIDGKTIQAETAAGRVDAARAMLDDLSVESKVTLGLSRESKALSVALSPRVSSTLSLIDNLDMVPREVRQIVLRSPSSASSTDEQASAMADQDIFIDVVHGTDDPLCNGEDCGGKLLREALRWNSLNLVALEPQLGRYFGTSQGVLVLTSGSLLELQAGDVILEVEGTPVRTPWDVMRVMGAKQPGDIARIGILRDKGQQQVQVTAPDQIHAALGLIPQSPKPPTLPLPASPASKDLPR